MSMRVNNSNLNQVSSNQKNDVQKQSIVSQSLQLSLQKQIVSFQGAQALKAANLVPSFSGSQNCRVESDQIVVSNILNTATDYDLPKNSTLNPDNLKLKSRTNRSTRTIQIGTDDKEVFKAVIDKSQIAKIPDIKFMTGKFNPSAEIVYRSQDPKIKPVRIIMLGGSEIKDDNFNFTLKGMYKPPGESSRTISFGNNSRHDNNGNNLTITTHHLENATKDSVESFMEESNWRGNIQGAFTQFIKDDKPSVVITAGGFGTRFLNISGNTQNKPSSYLPTSSSYRVMGGTLNLVAAMGMLDDKTHIKYLSQSGQLKKTNSTDVCRVNTRIVDGKVRNIGDGGAVAEALSINILDETKPMIIMGADSFTNADLTRPYHVLKTTDDAAMVIPYYPVSAERTKGLGLMSGTKPRGGKVQVTGFLEKPKNQKELDEKCQGAKIPKSDKYMASPAFYFLSPEVIHQLKLKGDEKEVVGFGNDFVPKILDMCNKGEIKNKKGKPMKIYTVPLLNASGKPAVWDDIGSAEAYSSLIRDVAHEVEHHGVSEPNKYYGMPTFVLHDLHKSVDLETGVICGRHEKAALNDFKKTYNVREMSGNIIVLPFDEDINI